MNDAGPNRRQFLVGGLGSMFLVPQVLEGATKQAVEQDCPVTTKDIEGPYWRPDAPLRKEAKLRDADDQGKILVVSGKVEGFPKCVALAGALIDVWQADHRGEYDNEAYNLRGRFRTDEKGRYEFETILPGQYRIGPRQYRPSHIHFKISHKGYAPLTTQLYFEGDPHLGTDPWAEKSRTVKVVEVKDKEEWAKRKLGGPFYRCAFPIVLRALSKSRYGNSYGEK